MKPATSSLAVLALVLSSALSPHISQAGASEVSDDFSTPSLSEKWKAAKGSWTVEDGKLKGAERAADNHAAVLTYPAPHADSKVSFAFQLAGSNGFHLSFNHPKGHLFRVIVSESDISLRADKDKKDPASKSVLLDRKKDKFEQGQVHTLTCETKGDTVAVVIDDRLKLTGTHASLASRKTGYRLVVKGDGVLFDDFAVSGLR